MGWDYWSTFLLEVLSFQLNIDYIQMFGYLGVKKPLFKEFAKFNKVAKLFAGIKAAFNTHLLTSHVFLWSRKLEQEPDEFMNDQCTSFNEIIDHWISALREFSPLLFNIRLFKYILYHAELPIGVFDLAFELDDEITKKPLPDQEMY